MGLLDESGDYMKEVLKAVVRSSFLSGQRGFLKFMFPQLAIKGALDDLRDGDTRMYVTPEKTSRTLFNAQMQSIRDNISVARQLHGCSGCRFARTYADGHMPSEIAVLRDNFMPDTWITIASACPAIISALSLMMNSQITPGYLAERLRGDAACWKPRVFRHIHIG